MTQQRISCLAAVLVSLCITFIPGGTNGCTDEIKLTDSIFGRNACPMEEVTFTCTAQGPAVFWRNEGFGERSMHYTSPHSGGDYRAETVSYDRNQSCLVSFLSFHATASRNGTTVTCISRNRTSNQSLSLHIISNIVLENLTVVPDSSSSVLLEWKVVPSDGHYCIRNYNIQITGPNGSHWEEEIPGSNHSFHFTGIQLMHLQNYTCCVTANLDHNQIISIKQTLIVELQGLEPSAEYTYCVTANISSTQASPTAKLTSTVNLQEPNPPANLSAMMTCGSQGYKIQIEWKAPHPAPLRSPLTGYLLYYHSFGDDSTIQLPPNTTSTSYMLSNVTTCTFNITVAALSQSGPSRNNPSVRLAIPCESSLVTACHCSGTPLTPIFTQVLTAVEDTGVEGACMVPPQRCSNCTKQPGVNTSTQTDCPESLIHSPASITLFVLTALISGVIPFCSGLLFAGVCNCILQCHKQWRIDRKSSKCTTGVVTQQTGGSPEYEEISTPESGSQNDVLLHQNAVYVAVQSPH